MIWINQGLCLPDDEVNFTFTRSGGPGGQNVNKLNTRATLRFNVAGSPSLTEYQKNRLRQKLANRINADGVLQIVAMRHRTQKANREDALARFVLLLASALVEKKVRRKRTIPVGLREKRLQAKKRRSRLKASRTGKNWGEEG